jgi:hypothetical protein
MSLIDPDEPFERDLDRLLASIDPQLQPGTFVFCEIEHDSRPSDLAVRMEFREHQGTTLIVRAEEADAHGLAGEFPCQWIVIGAHSDLSAVGFLAEITAALAAVGIGANVVSAARHDHLFVPVGQGERAVAVLREAQRRHRHGTG